MVVCHACQKPIGSTSAPRQPIYLLAITDAHGQFEGLMAWCLDCGPDAEVTSDGWCTRKPKLVDPEAIAASEGRWGHLWGTWVEDPVLIAYLAIVRAWWRLYDWMTEGI